MYNIELQQNFASDFNEKCHQVALLVRKAESKYENENENISTGESLPGVPGVSRNQKLSTEYDFNSFKVSFEVLTEYTLKNHTKTCILKVILWFFKVYSVRTSRLTSKLLKSYFVDNF